eukprot:symbB.v1.2.023455.t3/scaffold2145.1/size88005/1
MLRGHHFPDSLKRTRIIDSPPLACSSKQRSAPTRRTKNWREPNTSLRTLHARLAFEQPFALQKISFLACALATCLVAAQFQGASSGADVGAVEKEIANQTPQPAVPAEPGNRAVPAPSPTEKENRAAAPPARNRAVPAPSPTEKENRAASPSPTEKENRAAPAGKGLPIQTEKENRAALAGKGLPIEGEKENRAAR